ncbi:MAG: PIN domain-containing protein [Pseudomonadota bacterium]
MRPVVVLDACVLYPAAQRDFFMWLAAGGTIRVHWTNEIHEEWMRNVERDYRVARSVLERVRRLMDRAAGDALIGHYRQYESLFAKTDAKDRHVAAAAVAARKRSEVDIVTIITWNLGDFDRKELAKVGVVAETPDAFLCRLLADSPEEVIAALVRMQNNLRHPRKTTRECVDTLSAQGLKKFAGLISARIE